MKDFHGVSFFVIYRAPLGAFWKEETAHINGLPKM